MLYLAIPAPSQLKLKSAELKYCQIFSITMQQDSCFRDHVGWGAQSKSFDGYSSLHHV